MQELSLELDIEQMITDRIVSRGGQYSDAEKLISLIDDLADRKGLNADGLLMVLLDSCSGPCFKADDFITQLRINCGEFGI